MPEPIRISDDRGKKIVIGLIEGLNLDKPWSVEIKPYRKKRTLSQNGLYWKFLDVVVQAVHDETGNDKEDIHAFFKAQFLPVRTVAIGSETRSVPVSTTKLSTAEMGDYMTKIQAWCGSELGLLLPDPRDYGRG